MSKQEIKEKIEQLEKDLFILQMKDRYNHNDYVEELRLKAQIHELEKLL